MRHAALRPLDPAIAPAPPRAGDADLAAQLLAAGLVAPLALRRALAQAQRTRARLADVLRKERLLADDVLAAALARFHGMAQADLDRIAPDPRLIDRLGAARCLALRVLPLRRAGGRVLVALAVPEDLPHIRDELEAAFGPVTPLIAPEPQITARIFALRRATLRHGAETRAPAGQSLRDWPVALLTRLLPALGLGIVAAVAAAPALAVLVLTVWAVMSLVAMMVLKGAALAMTFRAPPPEGPAPDIARLPVVSVMVPLFRETDIAPRLLHRLGRLDYPRALLDVVLVLEEVDTGTRAALESAGLPGWMRVVVVPDGALRTKPRALNYALDFCRGSIIGVYDAEDAPDPDQIARVVRRFHERPPEVACLQGILDYYNPRTNWIARCFTIEYAAWFRVVMPGLQRMGIPLPLGGTTLFIRRAALERVGAWDAHNVTEDADLGIRLARHGLRTEMIETVTGEEANCRLRPWVKQRSRWIKGHMLTWAVHMRHPVRLWRDLGPRGFLGYQAVFLGAQSQFLLAPLLWSFWLLPLGVAHPVALALGPGALKALFALFLLAELVNLLVHIAAARRTRHRRLWPWAPTLHLYFPCATFAAWRALWEVFTRPFYWAKTSHGHFDGAGPAAPQRRRTSPASIFNRVSKAREIC